jgi:hypothetical protein
VEWTSSSKLAGADAAAAAPVHSELQDDVAAGTVVVGMASAVVCRARWVAGDSAGTGTVVAGIAAMTTSVA